MKGASASAAASTVPQRSSDVVNQLSCLQGIKPVVQVGTHDLSIGLLAGFQGEVRFEPDVPGVLREEWVLGWLESVSPARQ